MNYALVRLPSEKSRFNPTIERTWQPLCLCNVKNLINVKVIDAGAEKIKLQKLLERLNDFDMVFLTETPIDLWQCPPPKPSNLIYEVAKNLKALGKKVGVFGAHPTINPGLFNNDLFDYVIKGEPEQGILNIIKNKQKTRFVNSKPLNVNKLKPDFSDLNMNNYGYEIMKKPFTILETSRGCPYECNFCFKRRYRKGFSQKSVKNAVNEINHVQEKYNVKNVYYIDLEFVVNKLWVKNFCKEIIKENIELEWGCQTRVNSVNLEALNIMKRAGCNFIHYGLESGVERTLKLLKGLNKNLIKDKLNLTKKVGINSIGFFLLGLKNESLNDIKETIKFAKSLPLDYASFHIFEDYTNKNPTKNKDLTKLWKNAYIDFYTTPERILNLIKKNNKIKLFKKFINLVK